MPGSRRNRGYSYIAKITTSYEAEADVANNAIKVVRNIIDWARVIALL